MKRLSLILVVLLSLTGVIVSKADVIKNDTLCVYLKNGKIDIFPGALVKQHNVNPEQIKITLNNDSLITYSTSNVDSLGALPTLTSKFTSFKFNNKYNHNVFVDVFAQIGEDEITASVGAIGKWLTPSFQISNPNLEVYVDSVLQESKVSRHRFDHPVIYTIADPNHRQLKYLKVQDEIWSEEIPGEIQTEEIPLNLDMLSTNAPSNYDEGLDKLIDKNEYTFFHSTWGGGQYQKLPLDVPPYIEVSLSGDISEFVFKYTLSNSHNNRYPYEIVVEASKDKINWNTIRTLTTEDGMPTSGIGSHFTSPAIKMGEKYRHFRFKMTKASYKNYFVLAEFSMHNIVSETAPTPPHLISPAKYAYLWKPYGKDIPVKVSWLTDKATNVPRVDINVEGGKMITSKEIYLNAEIIIDGAGVFPNMRDSMRIKGRGNISWVGTGKSPYRLKFAQSVKPFGLTKGKNWVLLANRQNGSMISNAIGMKIANMVETAGANDIIPVELYINGNYRGSYNFTQHVGLHNNSVDIDETNAVLLELDSYYDETYKFLCDSYNICTNLKEPDLESSTIENAQASFALIKKDFNHFTQTLANGTDEYAKLIDPTMFARFMLVNELIMNLELKHPKSCFLFKEDLYALHSRYIFGPVWDFDWGYGYEFSYTYCDVSPKMDFYSGLNNIGGAFFKDLRFNSDAVKRAYYKEWKNFMDFHYQEVLDYIDDYYDYAHPSFSHNAQMWGDGKNYREISDKSRKWIAERAHYIFNTLEEYDLEHPLPIEVGDVNKDGAITIADVVCVQNHILNIENETFDAQQADANKNGEINITDAVWIVALALQENANTTRHYRLPSAEANINTDTFVATLGNESIIPVKLQIDKDHYTATQFDVSLPEGMQFEDVTLPDLWHGHTMEFSELGNNRYRVVIYAANGNSLPTGLSTLELHVTPQQMIAQEKRVVSLEETTLVTLKGEDERLGRRSARFDMDVTSIDNKQTKVCVKGGKTLTIEALSESNVKIYTVDGRMVKICKVVAGINHITLPSGVYIVNQKKVVINK